MVKKKYAKLSPADAIQKIENALKQFPDCKAKISRLSEFLAINGIPAFRKQVGMKFQAFLERNQKFWTIRGKTIRLIDQKIDEGLSPEFITSQQISQTCTLSPFARKEESSFPPEVTEREELTAKISTLQDTLKQCDDQTAQLVQYDELSKKLEIREKNLKEREKAIIEREKEMENKERQLLRKELDTEIYLMDMEEFKEKNAEVEALKSELTAKQARIKALNVEIDSLRKEFKNKIRDLKARVDAQEADATSKRSQANQNKSKGKSARRKKATGGDLNKWLRRRWGEIKKVGLESNEEAKKEEDDTVSESPKKHENKVSNQANVRDQVSKNSENGTEPETKLICRDLTGLIMRFLPPYTFPMKYYLDVYAILFRSMCGYGQHIKDEPQFAEERFQLNSIIQRDTNNQKKRSGFGTKFERADTTEMEDTPTIRLLDIPRLTTFHELLDLCRSFRSSKIKLPRDLDYPKGSRNRGFAFIKFNSHADAEYAKNTLNGHAYGTNILHAEWSRKYKNYMDTSPEVEEKYEQN